MAVSKSYFLQISEGISKVFWFGIEGDYRTLVIELLSKSLEDLF
jgi:hypothetical protein